MNLPQAERTKLLATLDQLARGVEELLLSGTATASEATRQVLGVAFQEASRLRLLRLSSTLRGANEELGRFTRNEPDFSRRRLSFFLNRSWLLSRGLMRAIQEEDEKEFEKLLWTPASQPVDRLEVVTLGIAKKIAAGAFCAFDFRLRTVASCGAIPCGQRLAWSCIFPTKAGVDIPAEGFLHLPQKQKFKANVFLEKKVVVVEKAAVALDDFGGGRLSLGEQSTVTMGDTFTAWEQFQSWDPAAALVRIGKQEPGPFDLDVEMQEEVVLHDWQVSEAKPRPDGQSVYLLFGDALLLDAVLSPGPEGKSTSAALEEQGKKKTRSPLFGLMHYERCRLVLQPLSALGKDGPDYWTISKETIDRAALLKALKF